MFRAIAWVSHFLLSFGVDRQLPSFIYASYIISELKNIADLVRVMGRPESKSPSERVR